MMKRSVAENIKIKYGNYGGSEDHGASEQERPNSPPINLKMRYKLAEELTVGNCSLQNAAQLYINQKKITDCLKNDVHRMKRYKLLKSSQGKAQEIYKDARRELHQCSLRFVAAYKFLGKAVATGQLMKYRKEYKTAEKSLAQLSALALEAIGTPSSQQQSGKTEAKSQKHQSNIRAEGRNILNMPKQAENEPAQVLGTTETDTKRTSDDDDEGDEEDEDSSEEEESESYIGTELDTVDEGKEDNEIHTMV